MYSEPLKEIVSKPTEVKELYLAKKGFDTLRDFEKFINLEILWLNNNLVTKVINLDSCTRIRKLYLQDNKITTLEGSIAKFKFLEVLLLQNNLLRDLQSVLDNLIRLTHLKQLNLLGNPCAEEEDYREIVISRLPVLEIFDRHVVTEKERAAAYQTLKIAPQLFRSPSDMSATKKSKPSTKTEMLVEKEAQKIRAATLQRDQQIQQQQQEAEALTVASKERAPSNFLPLPEALDFLKQKNKIPPSSPPPTLNSPSSTPSLPPLPHTRSPPTKTKLPHTPSESSQNSAHSSFTFETFAYPKANAVPMVEGDNESTIDGAVKTRMKAKITGQQALNKDYTEKKKAMATFKQSLIL